jgi:hypothetical protein
MKSILDFLTKLLKQKNLIYLITMFANKTWISNGIKKVKNPAKYQGVTDVYQGPILPNHDWKFQTENFNLIVNSLQPLGIYPIELYSASRAGKSSFTLCFSNPDIFWNKYEGEGYGSGQNYIYYKSYKIKTTIWIGLTPEQIKRIFDGENPDTVIK